MLEVTSLEGGFILANPKICTGTGGRKCPSDASKEYIRKVMAIEAHLKGMKPRDRQSDGAQLLDRTHQEKMLRLDQKVSPQATLVTQNKEVLIRCQLRYVRRYARDNDLTLGVIDLDHVLDECRRVKGDPLPVEAIERIIRGERLPEPNIEPQVDLWEGID